ncbi:MAG: hypothetical protein JSS83_17525 [Cyanobacteria bacterium SZAS LIN-3]|nr:hypothetical protein [Cyanobacteria bacterium SZAS LIN-3]
MSIPKEPDQFRPGFCAEAFAAGCKEFDAIYGSETECSEIILQKIETLRPPQCRRCQWTEIERKYGERFGICQNCKARYYLTAGTFFHGMKKARPYLMAIWLAERGIVYNANRLHKVADNAYASASKLFKKINTVIENLMTDCPITRQVSSGSFTELFIKRSTETPAREHPSAEQTEVEKQMMAENQFSQTSPAEAQLDGLAALVFKHLSDKPISFDTLLELTGAETGNLSATLLLLTMDELVESLPGNLFIRAKVSYNFPPASQEALDSFQYFIGDVFHGISRKYLQLYLAFYWACIDREYWQPNSLLHACCRFRPIELQELKSFVSAPIVKLIDTPT